MGTKGAIAESLAEKCELKKSVCTKILTSLAEIGAEGLKAGKFTLPGLVNIKLRNKPATKACKKEIFGKFDREGEAGPDVCEGLPCLRYQEALLSLPRLETILCARYRTLWVLPWSAG